MKKVYCKNCKSIYNETDIEGFHLEYVCMHPICFEKYDTPYQIEMKRINYMHVLNKLNNCKYYKRKWWKFWIK